MGIKINGVTKYTYAYNGNGDLYEIEDIDNDITICYNYDSLDRLISSWQKIGNSVDSYTYYSYDNMGRAYRSDFSLMGTAGGALEKHKIKNLISKIHITVSADTVIWIFLLSKHWCKLHRSCLQKISKNFFEGFKR